MTLDMGTDALRVQMREMQQRALYAMEVQAHSSAKALEADARIHAPWTDRSGAARNTMTGRAQRSGAVFTITLSGNVRHLVYLELARERKWAAMWPAMQRNAERILKNMARAGGFRS